jgi:hypothetical protein
VGRRRWFAAAPGVDLTQAMEAMEAVRMGEKGEKTEEGADMSGPEHAAPPVPPVPPAAASRAPHGPQGPPTPPTPLTPPTPPTPPTPHTPPTPLTALQWVKIVAPTLRDQGLLLEVTQYPGRCLKPIKPSSNTVFLTYLHTTYVSFIHLSGEVVFMPHDWQYVTLNLADSVAVSQEICTFLNTGTTVF